MQIERKEDQIIIKLPSSTDIIGVQRLLDYLTYREIASKSKATQTQIDQLTEEITQSWWTKNKSLFVG